MKKLDCVLLVDDDEATNFLNRELIEQHQLAHKVIETFNGQEALDYLEQSKDNPDYIRPNLIFLDINMPVMDGFSFMEHYIKLPTELKADIVVMFLTTSDMHEDRSKAVQFDLVRDFYEKPLTIDKLKDILQKHFTELNLG